MANPEMKLSICCKCEKKGSKFCNGCDLYYCTDCCNQRHRKGSFLRHSIVQVDDSPTSTCDECNSNAAVLKCVACELDLCSSCCQEVHTSGTMQKHLNEGYFKYFGSSPTTREAEVIGTGLSQAISGPIRKPGVVNEFQHNEKTIVSSRNEFGSLANTSTTNFQVADTSKVQLPVHNWSNWDLFSPNSKGFKEFSQWVAPQDDSSRFPNEETESNITEKYQSLNSLPAVNNSPETTLFPPFVGRFPSEASASGWGINIGGKNIYQKVDDIVSIMSTGDHPSRSILIRSNTRSFANSSYERIFESLKNFGDIQDIFSEFIDYGFILVTFYDLNASIQAQSILSSTGFVTAEQMQRPSYLEVLFSVPFYTELHDSPSIILSTPTVAISKQEIHQFCCQWGNVASVDQMDPNLLSYIVEYCDTRRAKKAMNEINGLIHWGGELRTDATPIENFVDMERLEKFKQIISSTTMEVSSAMYQSYNTEPDSIYMQPPAPSQNGNIHGSSSYSMHQGVSSHSGNTTAQYYRGSFSLNQQQSNGGQLVRGAKTPIPSFSSWSGSFGNTVGVNMRSVHPIPTVAFQNGNAVQYHSTQNSAQSRGVNYGHNAGKRTQNRSSDTRQSTGRNDQGAGEFSLNINSVKNGLDKRTTLMIRNIPNKYTQHMLLAEINENHKELYDFFYLPIDFKNKCNMGYAFINFIEYSSILPFYQEFSNQKWKNFNSEKVCAISYARLQGKAAMIARFQNSSLLDKDESYRPLVFFSSGVNRGKPEPFPVGKVTRKHTSEVTNSDIISNLKPSNGNRDDSSQCKSSRSSFPQMVELDQALGPRVQPAQ